MVSFFWFLCCHLPWVFSFVWLYCPLANSWCDVLGRYLQVEFSFFGKSFRVCCVYAPNRNPAQEQFFDNLHSKIDPSIPTVLCGDLNEAFDRSLDRAGRGPSSPCVTALPRSNIFSRTVVSSISGGISTLPLPVLLGPGGMAVWHPILIFLVCHFRGCLLSLHVILSLFLFRTIMVCVSRSRSPMLFPLV